jgi:hypothetical protein
MLHKNKLKENISTCCYLLWGIGIRVMMFNTTFNNISDTQNVTFLFIDLFDWSVLFMFMHSSILRFDWLALLLSENIFWVISTNLTLPKQKP